MLMTKDTFSSIHSQYSCGDKEEGASSVALQKGMKDKKEGERKKEKESEKKHGLPFTYVNILTSLGIGIW